MSKREFIDSLPEMETILRQGEVGFLGLRDADGPDGQGVYVVPLNYSYANGRILFHCGLEGHKLDCIRANPRVCFTVARQAESIRPHAQGGLCHIDSDSVICNGTARIVEDLEERTALLNEFNRAYRPGAEALPAERAKSCGLVEIRISEITGRQERQSKRTYWRHRF